MGDVYAITVDKVIHWLLTPKTTDAIQNTNSIYMASGLSLSYPNINVNCATQVRMILTIAILLTIPDEYCCYPDSKTHFLVATNNDLFAIKMLIFHQKADINARTYVSYRYY